MAERPEWMLTDANIADLGLYRLLQDVRNGKVAERILFEHVCGAQARKIAEWLETHRCYVDAPGTSWEVTAWQRFCREAKGEE